MASQRLLGNTAHICFCFIAQTIGAEIKTGCRGIELPNSTGKGRSEAWHVLILFLNSEFTLRYEQWENRENGECSITCSPGTSMCQFPRAIDYLQFKDLEQQNVFLTFGKQEFETKILVGLPSYYSLKLSHKFINWKNCSYII